MRKQRGRAAIPLLACALMVSLPATAEPLACVGEVPALTDRPCPDLEVTIGDAYIEQHLDLVVAGDLVISTVVATDDETGEERDWDWIVVAADRSTGERMWTRTHGTTELDQPLGILASPSGSTVYVAGDVGDGSSADDVEILALDAATGETRWAHRHAHPSGATDTASAMALSSDGSTLFVAGQTFLPGDLNAFVLAVDTDAGSPRFVTTFDAAAGRHWVADVAALPGGGAALLAQLDPESGRSSDALTVALDAEGRGVWRDAYDGGGNPAFEGPRALALSPDGGSLYMATESYDPSLAFGAVVPYRVATVAYDAATGEPQWEHRSDGISAEVPNRFMQPEGLTVAPDGTVVQIHQECKAGNLECSWGITAFEPAGVVRWEQGYDLPGDTYEIPLDLAAAPDGSTVFVTGASADAPGSLTLVHSDSFTGGSGISGSPAVTGEALTIAYDLATGEPMWTARYNSSPLLNDYGFTRAIALDPAGAMVYAAHTAYRGLRAGGSQASDYADGVLIGYRTSRTPPAGPPPQITDIEGDANLLAGAGIEQDTDPASYAPGDLRWVRIETDYVAVLVGEDGIHYEPTALVIRLGTTVTPRLPDPPAEETGFPGAYRLETTIGGLSVNLDGVVHRDRGEATRAAARLYVDEGCLGGPEPCWEVTRPGWAATIDAVQSEIVLRFAFDSLTPQEEKLLRVGNALASPRGEVVMPYRSTVIVAGGEYRRIDQQALVDATPRGSDFVIGSDVPADVPCTIACPPESDPSHG